MTSAEWKNLKGLVELESKQIDSAESLFLSALKQNPSYFPALVNLGILKRSNQDWSSARFYFESAYSNSAGRFEQEEISFYLVESWLRQVMKKDGLTQIEEVRSFLRNRLVGHSTFSHELQVIDIWISTLKKNWDEDEEKTLQRFLNLDPFILYERKRSPYFHRTKTSRLSYICENLRETLSAVNLKNSVVALCLMVNRQNREAVQTLTSSGSDANLSLLSFVYKLEGQDLKAEESLFGAMEQTSNQYILKFFMQARFCFEQGDMKCSAEHWKKALDIDQEAFTAHTGLARAFYEVGDMLRARTFLGRAEVFTSSYSPMIELQHLMKSKSK